MSKSGKFAIFWNFLSHVAGSIYWLFLTIFGSVYVIYRAEDAFMRLGGFAGVGISASIALLGFLGLKDEWKTLKNGGKTLKNDEEILENGWKTLKGNGDNDDIYEEDDAYEEDDIYEEDDDIYEEDDDTYEDDDDIYDDDAYDDDTYEDEEYDEELEQKTIKERAWEIFGNVLLKIPTEGVWGSIVMTIVGLIIWTLIGACIVIIVQVSLYIVSTLIRACL